jgi:hypothetical protein
MPVPLNNSSLLQPALAYAEADFPVFPLLPRSKKPLTSHGFKDATTDAAQIQRWWGENPRANIGMPTGKASELWVLDIDSPEGDTWLMAQGELPETPIQRTSKGKHLFFAMHEGLKLRNSQGKVAGVDVRADGGYIVLSPSAHPNGGHYEWVRPLLETSPANAPEHILLPFIDQPRPKAPLAPLRLQTRFAGNHKGLQILSAACSKIANAADGTQQGTLNGQSFLIGAIVAKGFLHPANAYHALMQAGLAMPSYGRKAWKESDIDRMIRRALKQGASKATH